MNSQYTGDPGLGMEERRNRNDTMFRSMDLAKAVAKALDEAHVPSVMFGWMGVFTAGREAITNEVDFVIPDAHMPAAIQTLVQNGYKRCSNPACGELHVDRVVNNADPDTPQRLYPIKATSMNRYHQVGAAHFHFPPENALSLSLHTQSSTLWWMPDIKTGRLPSHPDDILWDSTSYYFPQRDIGGSGPWRDYPVRAVSKHWKIQALMMLYCRELALGRRHLMENWKVMLLSLGEPPKYRSRFKSGVRIAPKLIPKPEFQVAWDILMERTPHEKSIWEGMWALRDTLAQSGRLGPLVDPNNYRKLELEEDDAVVAVLPVHRDG